MENAGAIWEDRAAFRDGNLVWRRVVKDISYYCGAVAKWQIWQFLQKIILIFQRLFVRRITKRAILQQRHCRELIKALEESQ